MKLFSVMQADLSKCMVTGSSTVSIHHVFPGIGRRKKCEKYGFIVALEPRYHNASRYSVHAAPNVGLDLRLKIKAQKYFEEHYGSRKDFIAEFGKSYLDG